MPLDVEHQGVTRFDRPANLVALRAEHLRRAGRGLEYLRLVRGRTVGGEEVGRGRRAHGYVIQRLIDGPQSVTAIARDLGVTQQGAKKVRELEKSPGEALEALGALDELQQRKAKLPSPPTGRGEPWSLRTAARAPTGRGRV